VSQPRVIPFGSKPKSDSGQPAIVKQLREHTRQHLLQLLRGLFDCTDDALFELADRSSSDADHHLYFHSMRQTRLQRTEIEASYIDRILADYDDLFRTRSGEVMPAAPAVDAASITLLHGDELEVNVAVSGIVSKITSQFSLPIMELTRRIDALCPTETVTERSNPIGPQRMCEAFVGAIATLEVDIRVRLILLKLYERLVMQKLLPLYDGANELLIKAGVLPELKRSRGPVHPAPRRTQPNQAGTAATGAASTTGYGGSATGYAGAGGGQHAGAGDAGFGGMSFGVIQNLLSGGHGDGTEGFDPSQPALPTPQLISVLNSVQMEALRQAAALMPGELPTLPNLSSLIASRVPDVTGSAISQLRRADDDVVNFIGMLFDYILNDRNLAIPMKALIARLQIPIVKLAILDKSFFERSAHPARQLLNELSSLGIGWSSAAELKRDNVYDMVESVVARILNDFNENPQIFADLLDELRAFRQRDEQRNHLLESRVRQTEAGKARTLAARQTTQQLINQKAAGMRLPPQAGRFISEVWSRVLLYACLKHGTQSPDWQNLVQTLDDLLWTLQPLQDATAIDRRDGLLRPLLGRIGAGIDQIQLPTAESAQWLQELEQQIQEISANDRTFLADETPAERERLFEEMEEIVLATVTELEDSYAGAEPSAESLARIDALREGNWIEVDQEGADPLRCKLTAIIQPGARYVFVNRRGMKVLERTRLALAGELQGGKLRILNDTQVFDRALQTVIGNLRQMQRQAKA